MIATPPKIAPLMRSVHDPVWSVMIPTYNCAGYLAHTLQSVLRQDPGPELMQIEVLDDCSNRDDPEAVVKAIGRGRVAFYRQPKNVGAIPNFNACIERSRGRYVHILHGDDTVEDGYYECIGALAASYPDIGLYGTRNFYIDAEFVLIWLSPRLEKLETRPPTQAVSIMSVRCNSRASPFQRVLREARRLSIGPHAHGRRRNVDPDHFIKAGRDFPRG